MQGFEGLPRRTKWRFAGGIDRMLGAV